MWEAINARENEKAEKESKRCWHRGKVAILDRVAGVGLSEKVTLEQRPDDLSLPLWKRARWPWGGVWGRGLPAKEAVPAPGRSPQCRADYVCAAGIVQSQLSGTASFSSARSFLWHQTLSCHSCAHSHPPRYVPRSSENGHLSVPTRVRRPLGQPGAGMPRRCCPWSCSARRDL